ncbi:restriction endonuclease subunit S [Leyella stercorea]|uniref:restriction endonuclease subunit S n=1 Tax=Leyella stercorea TaxID=363265 RepID=UPI0026DAEF36|nr:restriction endonuclease subunit S [Leyella stercorea]
MQKLGEIAEISTGFPFDGHKYTSIGIRVVRGENIGQGELHWEEKVDKRWNESTSALDNYWLYEGDIVMQMDGNVGKNIARIYTADPMLIAQRVACIRAKVKCSQDYIYGILRTKLFKNYIERCATGTSIKHISLQQISDFEFDFHLPEIQAKLGRIIADIDDKIRVNRQINDNLEAMAKQLYDYWFVQFDFPNEEGKPYKSSGGAMVWNEKLKREIPQGLDTPKIGDIEKNIITGKTPSCADEDNFGGDIPFVTIDDIRGNLFVFEAQRTLSTKGADSQEKKYLPIGSLSVSCIGTIGIMGFVARLAQTNQQINSIVFEHEYNKEFLYFSLKLYFENAKAKTGNVFANMSKEEFASIIVAYPPKQILQAFHNKVAPIFDSIKNNIEEINSLTKQRDELLPPLMNGQATVNSD